MSNDAPHFRTLWLRKLGRAVHLGHRDYARTVARALRRSGLPLKMTEGFHPHPKMQLPEPLPLGVGSEGEPFVIALTAAVPLSEVRARVAAQLPEDLGLVGAREGRCPDPRDLPLKLRVEGGDEVLRRCRSLDAGELRLKALEQIEVHSPESFSVVLLPHEGERVSIGRFRRGLEGVVAQGTGGRERMGSAETVRAAEGEEGEAGRLAPLRSLIRRVDSACWDLDGREAGGSCNRGGEP